MYRSRFGLFVLALVALCLVGPASAADDPKAERLNATVKDADEGLDNEWFGVYLDGKKVGYFNAVREKIVDGGKPFYRERQFISMKLTSFDKKSEMKMEQTCDFDPTPPFRLVKADYTHFDDKITQRIKLAAKDKGYDVTIVTNTVEQKKHLKELDFCMADSLSSTIWLRRGPAKGAKITTRDLEMEDLKLENSTMTLKDTKKSLINGVEVISHDVFIYNHRNKIEEQAKFNLKGQRLFSTIGGIFEMRRETEEQAKKTEFSSDIFVQSMAKIDKGFGDPSDLQALVLEFKSKEGALLPDGPRQSVVDKGNGLFELKTGKKYGKLMKATEKEIAEALEETTAYPIHEGVVKALAKKAVGDAKTDAEKAKRICQFVHELIVPSMEATIPKMLDLIDRKAGDCKSYALMFTCLCRAVGLPSREVGGYVYMGDLNKTFGGHAWNEILLDGYWVPVDASRNQVDADPSHISLGTDRESAGGLLKTFGKLNFKLVSAETAK